MKSIWEDESYIPGLGQLRLRFNKDADGLSRIAGRRVRYPFVVLRPFWFGDKPDGIASVILQSGSGGFYAGEKLRQVVVVNENAAAHLTSQAAPVVHASRDAGPSDQHVVIEVGAGGYFEYITDPVIMFPGAWLYQCVEARIHSDSMLIHADGVIQHDPEVAGRCFLEYGNTFALRDEHGALLFRDSALIDGPGFKRMMPRGACGWSATGLVVAAAPGKAANHDRWVGVLSNRLTGMPGVYAACGLLPNAAGLVCRVVAIDGQALRAALEVSWRECRILMTGSPAPRSRK